MGKRKHSYICEHASLSFFFLSLLFDSNHLISFKTQVPFCCGEKFTTSRGKKIAAIAWMCTLYVPQCLSFNSPAPFNLNENHGLDKGRPYNPQQVQGRIREILGKYSNGFWVSKLPQIYRELYKQDLPTESIKDLETWTHICSVCSPYDTLDDKMIALWC